MSAIKGTTERILDIRTGLLVIRGNELITKDEKIDLMATQVTDALNIAGNELDQRNISDQKLAKEHRKNKWQKWVPWAAAALGFGIGTQVSK